MRRRKSCTSSTRITASLLLSFLAVSSASHVPPQLPILPPRPVVPDAPSTSVKHFSLKHIFHHGTYKYPELHRRLDIAPDTTVWTSPEEDGGGFPAANAPREALGVMRVKAEMMAIQRLVDRSKETIDGILDWGRMHGKAVHLAAEDWNIDSIAGPNVTDKETVLAFARMASNAYITEPGTDEWKDVGCGYNYTEDFGWDSDGLRGHIFADTTNSTVVIGLKGTSPAVFDGSETTTNDKINDNLFFSCCCGQGGQYLWRQVCDCQTSAYTCNSTCLVTALRDKNRYYYAARDLYHNVTELYPNAEVWLAGHSLGGAVASFLGLTYGHPAVTFEAVPDAMPASRLGLPVPPGHQVGSSMQTRKMTGGYHFGHTADPVYMGQCNTASSSCTFGGYALQSVCHTGFKCVYDTVSDLGWRVGIGTHKILNVIHDVLESYDEPAKCEVYENCTDCFPWEFFESNGTETTTTSSTTTRTRPTSRTRTETCKTPGWWGCLDEPETTTTTTRTRISSSSTTCKTWGWFGCKDDPEPTTTTVTTTSSSQHHHNSRTPAPAPGPSITTTASSSSYPTSSLSSTTSCKHPGWFGGCDDDLYPTTSTPRRTSLPSSTTCKHPGWFGGCNDDLYAPTSTRAPTSTTCKHPGWFGCNDDLYAPTSISTSSPTPTPTSTPTPTTCTNKAFFGLICLDAVEPRMTGEPEETVEMLDL